MYWTVEGYGILNADFDTDAAVTYQAVFPDTENFEIEFSGRVTSIDGPAVTFDDAMVMTVTIKVTGQDTITS